MNAVEEDTTDTTENAEQGELQEQITNKTFESVNSPEDKLVKCNFQANKFSNKN